jgi:hypothetical protein
MKIFMEGINMAWTDQCRVAFKASAEHLWWQKQKETKKCLMKILAQLSEDSGIPQKTLYRWWNEEEKRKEKNLKNETFDENDVSSENDCENKDEQSSQSSQDTELSVCKRCNKRPVKIDQKTGKPYGKSSKYFGLCSTCRNKQHAISLLDKDVNEDNGILAICPKCNHAFYINKERINEGKL